MINICLDLRPAVSSDRHSPFRVGGTPVWHHEASNLPNHSPPPEYPRVWCISAPGPPSSGRTDLQVDRSHLSVLGHTTRIESGPGWLSGARIQALRPPLSPPALLALWPEYSSEMVPGTGQSSSHRWPPVPKALFETCSLLSRLLQLLFDQKIILDGFQKLITVFFVS